MKGTLLLLALLVTGELGFQTTEACVPFFKAFAAMATGSKAIMNTVLSRFDPTAQEREAFEKLQECYNELGLRGKFLDAKLLEAILFSPECMNYYTKDVLDKIKAVISKLTFL